MYSTNTSTHPSASLGVPAGQYAARGALGHLPHYACVRASCAWARIEPTTACPPSILPVIWELLLDGLHPPPRSHYPAVSGRVGGRSNVWIPWQNTLFPDSLEFLLSQQTAAGVVAEEEQSDAIYAYVRARIGSRDRNQSNCGFEKKRKKKEGWGTPSALQADAELCEEKGAANFTVVEPTQLAHHPGSCKISHVRKQFDESRPSSTKAASASLHHVSTTT